MHYVAHLTIVRQFDFGHGYHAVHLGKEGMIAAHADILAGPKLLAPFCTQQRI